MYLIEGLLGELQNTFGKEEDSMKSKSKEELKAIWKCNDKIAEQNFNRLENMNLYNRLTPAVLAYEGIAFQYMAPSVFEIQQFEYLQKLLKNQPFI